MVVDGLFCDEPLGLLFEPLDDDFELTFIVTDLFILVDSVFAASVMFPVKLTVYVPALLGVKDTLFQKLPFPPSDV